MSPNPSTPTDYPGRDQTGKVTHPALPGSRGCLRGNERPPGKAGSWGVAAACFASLFTQLKAQGPSRVLGRWFSGGFRNWWARGTEGKEEGSVNERLTHLCLNSVSTAGPADVRVRCVVPWRDIFSTAAAMVWGWME